MSGLALVVNAPFMPRNGFGDLSVRKAQELRLSAREIQVLQSLRQGLQTKEIADELGLKIPTVNGYVRDLYLKLGLKDRLGLGLWIAQHLPHDTNRPVSIPKDAE